MLDATPTRGALAFRAGATRADPRLRMGTWTLGAESRLVSKFHEPDFVYDAAPMANLSDN